VNVYIALILAAAPALLLLRYYYRQDRARPEPKRLVLKVFIYGLISAFVAIPLELFVGSFRELFSAHPAAYAAFKAFVVAALVEEYLKLTVVRMFAYRDPAFDEIMDGVVYTVVASLGFACMENVLYLMGGTLLTAVMRAVTAVPLHATASGLMGYHVGRAKFARSATAERWLLTRGLLTAVVIHGTYDFLLFMMPEWGPISAWGVVPLVLATFFVLRRRIRSAVAADRAAGRLDDGAGPTGTPPVEGGPAAGPPPDRAPLG
jgi:RsiW-degrading membrane proteinase PrsW (M82 family)